MATTQRSNEERIACSILEQHHSSLSQSMTSPNTVVRICQILYSKKFITEGALDEVESSDTALEDKREILLAAMTGKTAIFIDHRKLHELATVLEKFKETKSVANNILNDYNVEQKKMPAISAKEAVLKNTSRLIDAVTGCSFQGFVTGCAEKSLITPYYRNHLLHDTPMNKEALLIGEIEKVVHFQPSCLDTVLCILIDKCGIPGTVVAEAVAKDYGHMLPNYEKTKPTTGTVGGATSVVSSDDNVDHEGMVPQMSNEDRASDILRTHYSTLSQSLKDPVNIARLLHGENVISEDAVTQVESAAIKDRTTVLLGLVRKVVHGNHQHLKVFGRVLQQLTAGNERVGQDILNDYNKVFPTTSIFSMTSTPSTTTVQSTTAGVGATDVHYHITRDMEKEFSAIRGKFAKTFHNVKKTLTKHNISVDDIKSFCKFAFAKNSQEINDCQTMEDVLTFVATKCTLINISILRELIDDCEIDEAKQHIQDYQQAIDDFSQKMRARFPLNQSLLPDGTPHPLRGETITFVMKWVSEIVSLDDIENLQTNAFGSLFENVKVIKMEPTKSVIITCSFPFELTGLLMTEAMKNLKLLKKNGLLKLTIGYCTIWNIRDEQSLQRATEMSAGSLPNDNDPEDVLRQILDWSQNRPARDLHKLQTLIENANGHGKLEEPVQDIQLSKSKLDIQIQLIKEFFEKNKCLIFLCATGFALVFIAFLFGLLLGVIGTQGAWQAIALTREALANITNAGKNQDISPPDHKPEKNTYFDDPSMKDRVHQQSDGDDKSDGTCNGNTGKYRHQDDMSCTDEKNQLEHYLQTNISAYFGCKTNITTYSNKLTDILEEYNSNNGKEWSQWCIQEWMKQGDTSPDKPTASMDINKHFDKLVNISIELNQLMKLMPDK